MFWTDFCYSFSDESLSDVDNRNNDNVGDLSDWVGGETGTDSRSIFDGYSDVSDDENDGVNAVHCTINAGWFDFCKKEKVSVNPSTCKVWLESVQ